MSGHRFSFEKAHKLDDHARLQEQPPERVVSSLDLQSGQVVVDLGVGTGFFALPVARRLVERGGGRVIGIDIEPRMLDLLRSRAGAAGLDHVVEALAVDPEHPAKLPVETASADRAFLVGTLHELPDPEQSLRELWRVLRPGALILIVDWDPDATIEKGPPREHRVAPDDAERLLRATGFSGATRLSLYDNLYALRAVRSS